MGELGGMGQNLVNRYLEEKDKENGKNYACNVSSAADSFGLCTAGGMGARPKGDEISDAVSDIEEE